VVNFASACKSDVKNCLLLTFMFVTSFFTNLLLVWGRRHVGSVAERVKAPFLWRSCEIMVFGSLNCPLTC